MDVLVSCSRFTKGGAPSSGVFALADGNVVPPAAVSFAGHVIRNFAVVPSGLE
jgi:hypothetical protein